MCKNKAKRQLSKTNTKHQDRRLFAIDIENYCGKPELSEADVASARQSVYDRFSPNNVDLVVIGTSHSSNFFNTGMAWRGARNIMMKGHDGADRALIQALAEYHPESFSEIVLFSGDGIFTDSVNELSSRGAKVTVVSRSRSLSKQLSSATQSLHVIRKECIRPKTAA
jgi:hypothetical protein